MSLLAHPAEPAHPVLDPSFELVHERYVAVPALMWLAAICVVMLVTMAQSEPARLAGRTPVAESGDCFSHGA